MIVLARGNLISCITVYGDVGISVLYRDKLILQEPYFDK